MAFTNLLVAKVESVWKTHIGHDSAGKAYNCGCRILLTHGGQVRISTEQTDTWNLRVSLLEEKLLKFYGPRNCITIFKTARPWALIKSETSYPVTERFLSIQHLDINPGSPKCFFQVLPLKLCTYFSFTTFLLAVFSACLTPLYFIILTITAEEYREMAADILRSLRLANHSSRGVQLCVVCVSLIEELHRGGLGSLGSSSYKKITEVYKRAEISFR